MVLDLNLRHDVGTAQAVLAGREDIEAFLRSLALELKDEAYEQIRRYDAVNNRTPPLFQSAKTTSRVFGFRRVWGDVFVAQGGLVAH